MPVAPLSLHGYMDQNRLDFTAVYGGGEEELQLFNLPKTRIPVKFPPDANSAPPPE